MSDDDLLHAARRRIGDVLRGKYRLDRVIGVGGMAAVYAATHRNNKQFAVKMLHAELSSRADVKARFLREGYVANTVQHPGAVAVLDDDVAEDGAAFLVMELLVGVQVNDLWLQHGKRMPLGVVMSIGDALLDVLASAHARGIVHRDIKPPNLFLTCDGVLKVLDFGIARLRDSAGSGHGTVTGALMGTPAFMAPEQALAKVDEVDAQTDLWAVGATMFSLLGGEIVHTGDNASQLLVQAATTPARLLSSVTEDAPPLIAAVVDKSLEFDKANRWATAAAMREALSAACTEVTGAPIPPLPRPEPHVPELGDTLMPKSARRWSDSAFAPTVDPSVPDPPLPRGVTTTERGATTQPAVPDPRPPRRSWPKVKTAVAACAGIVALALAYEEAYAPHARYCALVLDARDGPRCVLPIDTATAARRRERTAHVTEVHGRIQSVAWATATTLDADEVSSEAVVRDRAGEVREIISKDRHGRVVRWEKWTRSDGGAQRIDLVDLNGETPRTMPRTGISTIRREYDARGRVARETYFGPTGKPRSDVDGSYGATFEYGKLGRWTKRQVLAADGRPGVDLRGRATYLRADDDSPTGRSATQRDVADRPMSLDGVYGERNAFDDTGSLILHELRSAHDEPAIDLRSGLHGFRQRWNPAARVLEAETLDEHDRVHAPKGESSATTRTTFDPRGLPVLVESLDANGNRTRRRGDGVSAIHYEWSSAGDELTREYLDPDGAPMLGEGGFARRQSVYDPHGALSEQRYFDATGQPAPWKGGGAIERYTVDERGLVTRISNFDGGERPTTDGHGVHETRRKLDRLRNKVEESYFDIDGHPTVNEDGVSRTRWKYDDDNDLAAVHYFDDGGAPVMVRGEKAAERYTYDDRGLLASSEALDAHGEPTLRSEGYATARSVRDRNGDVLGESFFGKHDELMSSLGGCARKAMKYDEQRRVLEVALKDVSGQATVGADGWAIQRTEYDADGLVVREDFLDPAEKLLVVKDRGASVVKSWDPRGNLVAQTFLGVDGKPTVSGAEGYATRTSEYDGHDRLALQAYLGRDGEPVVGEDGTSVRRIRYDDAGNIVEEAYFDGNHAAVAKKGVPYASVRYAFDSAQRLVETSYFDATGAPSGEDGVATVRYVRDGFGRATETTYLDRAGAPTKSREGKAIIRSSYDAGGRLVLERFYGASGELEISSDGCAGYRMKHDAHGRDIETVCLNTKEEPAASKLGFAIQRTVHDGRGNDVDVSTLGANGLPEADAEGISRRHSLYNERNLLASVTYFDASDRPTRDKRGVHETRFPYSDTGKALAPSYFDEAGNSVTLDSSPMIIIKDLPPLPSDAEGAHR